MARAIWSGAISFGLVNVPVKLYSAVSRKSVKFNQLNADTGNRIQQKRVDAATGDEVNYESLVKGFEIAPDRYVVVTPDELATLEPERSRQINIEDFVPADQIDPIYYDHPYYLAPATGAAKAYELLLQAMEKTGRVAIARVVIRQKDSLVAIRPSQGKVLEMSTMVWADEIVPPDEIDDLPDPNSDEFEATARELEMAISLIESLSSNFEPEKYRDAYRDEVLALVERKAAGEEITMPETPEEPQPAPDLMAALEASINAVKSRSGAGAASGNGTGEAEKPKRATAKKSPAAKKAPAKKQPAKSRKS
jgi:DNA end-binding protein Ku